MAFDPTDDAEFVGWSVIFEHFSMRAASRGWRASKWSCFQGEVRQRLGRAWWFTVVALPIFEHQPITNTTNVQPEGWKLNTQPPIFPENMAVFKFREPQKIQTITNKSFFFQHWANVISNSLIHFSSNQDLKKWWKPISGHQNLKVVV